MKMPSKSTEEGKRRKPGWVKPKADLVLKERDREILSLVHEHRFLTTDLIWRLMRDGDPEPLEYEVGKDGKNRPKTYGFGEKALYKRLQALFQGGFLARHYVTDQPIGGSHGLPRAVYGLGLKAAAPVAELVGVTPDEIRQIVEANKVKSPFLRHALEVAKFKVTLMLACRGSQGRVSLTFWEQGMCLRDYVSGRNEDGDEERVSVYPDAFFGLSVQGKGLSHYFLEIDRGTMSIVAASNKPDIRKKVIGYKWYSDSRRHSQRYFRRMDSNGQVLGLVVNDNQRGDRVVDPSLVPINGFRALFVIPGSSSDGSPNGRLANVLSAVPMLGKAYSTSSLFWFASYDGYSVERPLSIFDHIWIVANPTEGRQSLIEGD